MLKIYNAHFSFISRGKEPWTLSNNTPDSQRTQPARLFKEIQYPKPDGVLSFDLLTSLSRSGDTRTVLKCTVLHRTALYCATLHWTAFYYTALYCTILYFTILYLPPNRCFSSLSSSSVEQSPHKCGSDATPSDQFDF